MYRVCAAAIIAALSISNIPLLSDSSNQVLLETKFRSHHLNLLRQVSYQEQNEKEKWNVILQSNSDSNPSNISSPDILNSFWLLFRSVFDLSIYLIILIFGSSFLCFAAIFKIIRIRVGNEAIVERFGKYHRKLRSGTHILIRFVEEVVAETSTALDILNIEPQKVLSKNGVEIEIEVILYWRIISLEDAFYIIEDFKFGIRTLIETRLKIVIGRLNAEDVVLSHENIKHDLIKETDEFASSWGIEIMTIEVKNIDIPEYFREVLQENAAQQFLRPVEGNTLKLSFTKGINTQAFQYSWDQLRIENEGIELKVVGLEERDDGFVVVKVKVPPESDAPKLYHDFMKNYESVVNAIEEKYRAELKGKDDQIAIYKNQTLSLENIVSQLASRPLGEQPVTIEVKANVDNALMGNNNDQSRKIEIGTVGGDLTASGAALNLGEISDTVANTINQISESSQSEQPSVKQLLQQLHQLFTEDDNLTEEDKAEALEQIQVLAEASQKPDESTMRKAAKTALKVLRGTMSALPPTLAIVKVCQELLPKVAECLGL